MLNPNLINLTKKKPKKFLKLRLKQFANLRSKLLKLKLQKLTNYVIYVKNLTNQIIVLSVILVMLKVTRKVLVSDTRKSMIINN